jgi:hypothetical protein
MIQDGDTYTLPLPGLPPPRNLGLDADLADPAEFAPPAENPAESAQPLPAWRVALNAAIAADPRGKAGVAARFSAAGYQVSRCYISRATTGDLRHGALPTLARHVASVLMQVDCPHLGQPLQPAACRAYAERSYAQISQFEVDHWRACRKCPQNPTRTAKAAAQESNA